MNQLKVAALSQATTPGNQLSQPVSSHNGQESTPGQQVEAVRLPKMKRNSVVMRCRPCTTFCGERVSNGSVLTQFIVNHRYELFISH